MDDGSHCLTKWDDFYRENMASKNICLRIKVLLNDESTPLDWMNCMYALCPVAMTWPN
jgi:hypothetical protein